MSVETIKQFATALGLKMDVDYADSNPSMSNDNWQANHYKLTIKRKFKLNGNHLDTRYGFKQMTTFFSQGIGIQGEPEIPGVLECLQGDCQSAEYSFEDFCGEFGYDQDSRKAFKTYKACGKIKSKLHKFLDADFYRFIKADRK